MATRKSSAKLKLETSNRSDTIHGITIEDGIEMPSGRRSSKWREVLDKMGVDSSFAYDGTSMTGLYKVAGELGIKVAGRKTETGFRVWRTE